MNNILETVQHLAFFNHKKVINVEEISSGLSQQSFKVNCENNQIFYAKYFNSDNSEYALVEKEVLANSASSEITLPLLYSDQHWFITPYFQANDLAETVLPTNQKLYIALDLMLTFQKITIDSEHIKSISFLSHGSFYINALGFNETQQQLLRSLLSDDERPSPEHEVLCHGDLNYTNMLFDLQLIGEPLTANTHVKLIDFECCCYAEIEYDIAMLIAVNNLLKYSDVEIIITDVKRYLLANKVHISRVKVMRYLCKSLLLNALWYICRFNKTNDIKWQHLAQQQFQQADVLNNNEHSIADSLSLYFP